MGDNLLIAPNNIDTLNLDNLSNQELSCIKSRTDDTIIKLKRELQQAELRLTNIARIKRNRVGE